MHWITKDQLKNSFNPDDYFIIDIRETDEFAREHIDAARNIPLSTLKKEDVDNIEKPILFYCRSGMRTENAKAQFESLGLTNWACLKGGIETWKSLNLKVVKNEKAPLPIIQQVHIMIGSMVLLGMLLAWIISPWFILITIFMGCGLIVAGVTGFCGLAKILPYMPWNRR